MGDSDEKKDPKDNRNAERYIIKDSRVWKFKVDNKDLPFPWMEDLSWDGARIKQGGYGCYNVGDKFPVQVRFMGQTIVGCYGEVKWKKPVEGSINLFELGVEFKTSDGESDLNSLRDQISKNKISKEYLEQFQSPVIKEPNEVKQTWGTQPFLFAAVISFSLGILSKIFF